MAFLIKDELKTVSTLEIIDIITNNDDDIVEEIIDECIDVMKTYLGAYYDMDEAFAKEGDDRNKTLLKYLKALVIYEIPKRRGKRVPKDEADDYFIANEIIKDANGVVVRENGEPKRKNNLKIGRYDIILTATAFNRGSSTERQKVWAEYIKAIQVTHPHLVPRMIEMSLRDTDSPIANKVSQLIEEDKKAQAQGGQEQQQAQMKQMELNMQTLQAKLEEIMSKTNLNNAKAQEVANNQAS